MTGAILGAAGISAAAGVGSSIASNNANKDIQQQSNAFNEKMLDKQIAYNKEMYAQQLSDNLKYSDPAFLRNRLEGAGYNAGVLAAGGNLGQAVSSASMQGVNPPQSANRVADYSGIGNAIGGAIDLYNRGRLSQAQTNKTDVEAQNLRIEGKYIAQKAIADLNRTLAETKNAEARTATEDTLRGIRRDMLAMETDLNREQAQKIAVERRGQVLQNMMTSTQLQFLPQQIKMTLANGAADIALKKSQQKMTDTQVKHEVRKMINTVIEGQGKQLQYQFDKQTFSNRLRQVEAEVIKAIHSQSDVGIIGAIANSMYYSGFVDKPSLK